LRTINPNEPDANGDAVRTNATPVNQSTVDQPNQQTSLTSFFLPQKTQVQRPAGHVTIVAENLKCLSMSTVFFEWFNDELYKVRPQSLNTKTKERFHMIIFARMIAFLKIFCPSGTVIETKPGPDIIITTTDIVDRVHSWYGRIN